MPVYPLLAILFLGFAISTNALTEAASPTTTCLYKSAKQLTIDPKHAGTKVNTCSQLSCIATHCKAVEHCAVSFHPETGQCLGVSSKIMETLPALSKSGQLFKASKDGWLVIVSGHMAVNKASTALKAMKAIRKMKVAAFWPLDIAHKGRNLGTKGEVLNMDVPGVLWDSQDPNGSEHRCARFTKQSRAKVQLKKNGELALNLTTFTIGAWIKRDSNGSFDLLKDDSRFSIYFGKYPSDNIVKVSFDFGSIRARTKGKYKLNPKTANSWHHFAAVFLKGESPNIYIDMSLESSARTHTTSRINPLTLPSKLNIGFSKDKASKKFVNHFVGGMACLFIAETALKPEEIKQLKNSCP